MEKKSIPVLNQPLSAHQYYVIARDGPNKGEGVTSSMEMKSDCCCWGCSDEVATYPLRTFNSYQQFRVEWMPHNDRFRAQSMAPDGLPPRFMRDPWKLYVHNNQYSHYLPEALGLNSHLRAQLPDFTPSCFPQPLLVGKWYCPFMFVVEYGKRSKEMMNKSLFYEMTLEQRWVEIFSKENSDESGSDEEKEVCMEVEVETKSARIGGKRDVFEGGKDVVSGVYWFSSYKDEYGKRIMAEKKLIGLSIATVERMKWEEERVGWVDNIGGIQRLKSVEKFKGNGKWRKFSCYLLMESFVLKTMDGKEVLTCDYNHTHQLRRKWWN